MCGRYTLICIDDLGTRFRLYDPTLGYRSHFNIAPGQVMPVIIRSDHPEAVEMVWGLDPDSLKDRPAHTRHINARAETIADHPASCRLLEGQRCLIPANGFYEWTRHGSHKTPFYFQLKGSPIFAFAGIYHKGTDPGCGIYPAYLIITTPANDRVSPIHNRMPAILRREDESRWLAGALSRNETQEILSPFPPEEMEAYPVSTRVNRTDADDESLIRPLETLA